MQSGPVCCLVLGSPNIGSSPQRPTAVRLARDLLGCTDPLNALEGTVRKEFGTSTMRNAVHASETEAAYDREINIWFGHDDDDNNNRVKERL